MAEVPAEEFRNLLNQILAEYPTPDNIGEGTDFETATKDHPLYQLVVDEAGEVITELIDTDTYTIKASVGRGSPTHIPYIAVLHGDETTSPQQGRYVIYLFDPIAQSLYLTLNQGAKEATETAAETDATPAEILRSRAAAMASDITSERFTTDRVEFGPTGRKAELYGAGTICYAEYSLAEFPDADTIATDLDQLLDIYQETITRPIDDVTDDDPTPESTNPSVWIEKTRQEGRPYKQSGPLALGKALISPSRDGAGRKRYEEMREADVGDIVLHLLHDNNRIVGVSCVASPLQEDFEGPPNNRWEPEQREQGGYKRELTDYTELEEPLDIYDRVLDNDDYQDQLNAIKDEVDGKLLYTKRRQLNQGHYFTKVPEDLVVILTQESDGLRSLLQAWDIPLHDGPENQEEAPETYDTLPAATEDIRNRLEGTGQPNWLSGEVTATVIEDWSAVLAAFDPQTPVSPTAAVRLQQIQELYADQTAQLQEYAQTLQIGSLRSLDATETLFAVLLRDLQEESGVQTAFDEATIAEILHDDYAVETTGDDDTSDPPTHPLLDQLASLAPATPIRKFTAPPDYWLTALQYGSVSFEAAHQDVWDELQAGEVVFLHSRAEPGTEGVAPQPNGIFGVGIVGAKTTKDEPWWPEERDDTAFPYISTFERLFVTSETARLDIATPVDELSTDGLTAQLAALTDGLLDYEQVQSICTATNGINFPAQSSHGVFRDHDGNCDHDRPRALLEAMADRLDEVSTINPQAEFEGGLTTEPLDSLYFPGKQAEQIIEEIEAAIATGKHIILTGPPGTGKTEIARRVAKYLVAEFPHLYSGFELTTATADWSTFDTVGGYMPEGADGEPDQLTFTPGVMLNRLKDRQTTIQRNEPVIIDELNRADIDKAFGQLFTLLSGQAVKLPYTTGNNEIELRAASQETGYPEPHQYLVPTSWRIFATMNTYDKTSLYEMSYAFMRRFAFIRVGAPDIPETPTDRRSLMAKYASPSVWDIDATSEELEAVGTVWRQMNQAVEDRAIGPAIVKDMLEYVCYTTSVPLSERLTRAVVSYIFPQLEGVPKRKQILTQITAVETVDTAALHEAATEMLQVGITHDE